MNAILSIANLPATTSNAEITQRFRENRGFLSSRVYFNERLSTIIGEVEFINYECAEYALRAIQAYPLPSDAFLRMHVEYKDSFLNNTNNNNSNYQPEDNLLYGQNNKNLNGFPQQNMPYTNISGIDDMNSRARSDSRPYAPSIPQQPYDYPPYSKEYQGTFQESSKIPQGYQPQLKQPLQQPSQPSQVYLAPPPGTNPMQQFSQPCYDHYGMNRQSEPQQQQPSLLGQSQLVENNAPIFQNKPPTSFQPQNFIQQQQPQQQQSFPAPPQQRPLPPTASSATTASSSYQDINPYNSSQFSQPAQSPYSQPIVQQSAQNYQPPRQQSSSQYRQSGNAPNHQLPSKIPTQPQQQASERQEYYPKPTSSSSNAILGQELVRAVVDLHTAEMNDYHEANIATNSLYIDGVPLDSHEREVAHVFRPFPGFQNIRLIRKRTQAGREFYFCFADFEDALSASVALKTLQGYHFDKNDLQGLKLAFANENRLVKKVETTGNIDRHSDHHRHEEPKRHREYDRDYSPQKYDNKQESQHRNTGNSHNNSRGSNYGAGDSNSRSFQHRHY